MSSMTDPKEEVHWPITTALAPDCSSQQTDLFVDAAILGCVLTSYCIALGLADSVIFVTLLDARDIGWGHRDEAEGSPIQSGVRQQNN